MVGHTKVPDLEDAFFAMVPEDLTSRYDAPSAHPSPRETGRQLSSYKATMAVPWEMPATGSEVFRHWQFAIKYCCDAAFVISLIP
jgi:hypothetical protein